MDGRFALLSETKNCTHLSTFSVEFSRSFCPRDGTVGHDGFRNLKRTTTEAGLRFNFISGDNGQQTVYWKPSTPYTLSELSVHRDSKMRFTFQLKLPI